MGRHKSFPIEQLRELAGQKIPARRIADILQVSRQRVYKVAKINGIDVCTQYETRPKAMTD